eukprot:SAG11_NODE_1136_length_5731_cov_23.656250_3_plen_110_part_00
MPEYPAPGTNDFMICVVLYWGTCLITFLVIKLIGYAQLTGTHNLNLNNTSGSGTTRILALLNLEILVPTGLIFFFSKLHAWEVNYLGILMASGELVKLVMVPPCRCYNT